MPEAVVTVSRYPYAQTIATLSEAIAAAGATSFAQIDQSAAAATARLELRPTTLFIFGNPKGGTPLMEAFPLAALDLPLKLLVWQEDGRVNLAFVPVATVARRYGVTGHDELLAALQASLDGIVAHVA